MKCLECDQDTQNPKFCSRSCAAKYNNRKFPKRKRTKLCPACNQVSPSERTYHKRCYEQKFYRNYSKTTLADLKNESGSRNSYSVLVHAHGRKVAERAGLLDECAVCSYSLHVDCCHITAVSNFPETAVLTEVNAESNLIGLCKNHHWELDNGYLKLSR